MNPLVRVCCVGAVAMVATTVMAQPTSLLVGPFSHLAAGGMPVGWEQMRFPSITEETEYGLVSLNGRVVLEARSHASASAALKRVSIDVERRPVIEWSWKTNLDCYAGDWGDPETDDFPLRRVVIFEPTGGMFSRLQRLGPGFQGDFIVYVPQLCASVGASANVRSDLACECAHQGAAGRAGGGERGRCQRWRWLGPSPSGCARGLRGVVRSRG